MSLPIPADDSAPVHSGTGHSRSVGPSSVGPSSVGPSSVGPEREASRLTARGPGELLQVIPYLLGFHPEQSVVLVALKNGSVLVSARFDLEAPPEAALPWLRAAHGEGASSILVVLYSELAVGPPLAQRAYADRLGDLAAEFRLEVADRLAVSGDRWWSFDCSNPRCCPPEGTVIDRSGAVAAGAVAEGLVSLPRRSDLGKELSPLPVRMAEVSMALSVPDADCDLDLPDCQRRAEEWSTVRRFVRQSGRRQGPIPAEEAAAVLWALVDVHVRDAALSLLAAAPDAAVTAAWRELTRLAPPPWRAPVATLYAFWCYARGEGARANVAIETALAADPEYSLALLLGQMVESGMNPLRFIPELARGCRPIARRIERRRPPVPPT